MPDTGTERAGPYAQVWVMARKNSTEINILFIVEKNLLVKNCARNLLASHLFACAAQIFPQDTPPSNWVLSNLDALFLIPVAFGQRQGILSHPTHQNGQHGSAETVAVSNSYKNFFIVYLLLYMERSFQKWFMDQVAAKLPPSQALHYAIKQVLGLSDSAVYKKIRQQSELKGDEIMAVARHFDISLDRYVHQDHPSRGLFEYPPIEKPFQSPSDFLGMLGAEMTGILSTPAPSVWYATNEIPIFHYMAYRSLLAFKLYVWSRTSWMLPQYLQSKFSVEEMYARHPDIEACRHHIAAFYARVPSKEYWPPNILDHTLSQIRHCVHANFFDQPDLWSVLLQEMRDMLHNSLDLALRGTKSGPEEPHEVAFELFSNEFAYTNNTILVFSASRPVSLYVTFDNPNFAKTTSTDICQKMRLWMNRIENTSVRISKEGERQRHRLFQQVEAKIEALERELASR